jgi:hypothetical protein
MANHTTNEGWELFKALEVGGYCLGGHGLGAGTDVRRYCNEYNIRTIVLQDKREWEGKTAGLGFDRREMFTNVGVLRDRTDVFKLTILKDAQHNPEYHRQSADEIGAHGWIIYYHPRIIKHLAPYVRERHLIRTYHTVDREIVPPYTDKDRKNKALLSGAISDAYPLRKRLYKYHCAEWDYRFHPGYGRKGCDTPNYLKALSHYKVAICTASRYGYALRKLIEGTAAGCRIITDLPRDDVLPFIDGNLVRIDSDTPVGEVQSLVNGLVHSYDPLVQYEFSEAAKVFYDYRAMGRKLADDIESLRRSYHK